MSADERFTMSQTPVFCRSLLAGDFTFHRLTTSWIARKQAPTSRQMSLILEANGNELGQGLQSATTPPQRKNSRFIAATPQVSRRSRSADDLAAPSLRAVGPVADRAPGLVGHRQPRPAPKTAGTRHTVQWRTRTTCFRRIPEGRSRARSFGPFTRRKAFTLHSENVTYSRWTPKLNFATFRKVRPSIVRPSRASYPSQHPLGIRHLREHFFLRSDPNLARRKRLHHMHTFWQKFDAHKLGRTRRRLP